MTISNIKPDPEKQLQVLRFSEMMVKTGLSRSAIYDRIDKNSPRYDPQFPVPIRLGNVNTISVGFIKHEVDVWIEIQMNQNRYKVNS